MPALQGIFNSITEMRYSISSVNAMYNDIKNLKFFDYSSKIHDQLKVNENITLNNINFHYPNAVKTAIKNLNLSINLEQQLELLVLPAVVKLLQLILFLACLKLNKEL